MKTAINHKGIQPHEVFEYQPDAFRLVDQMVDLIERAIKYDQAEEKAKQAYLQARRALLYAQKVGLTGSSLRIYQDVYDRREVQYKQAIVAGRVRG